MDLGTLTLIATVVVTPILTAIGYVYKRNRDKADAKEKGYLDKIDVLQERIFTMQAEAIKAEQVRAASTGDTNQILKTLAGAVDALSKPKVPA